MKSISAKWGLAAFSLVLFGNAAVGHATNLTVSSAGNGKYVVQGTGFEGVAATEVVVQYDQTALANPRVEQGGLVSGSMMVTNTSQPGVVRIATVSGYPQTKSGTGTIATITFETTGSSSGNVSVAQGSKILNVSGAQMPLAITPLTDSTPVVETTPSGGATTTATAATAGSGTVYPAWLGGVTMPDDGTKVEAKVRDEASGANPVTDKAEEKGSNAGNPSVPPPAVKVSQTTAPAETKIAQGGSVLEQFRLFQGEKTPKALEALFTRMMEGSRQMPPVVLSDGKTPVKVSVDIASGGKTAPNFACKGAKLISLKKSGDSTWVLEVLPTAGTVESTIIVLQDGIRRQISLTVAPPLPAGLKIGTGGKLSEADFSLFLKERGSEKAPQFDLNNDGKRDYIDDYIFAANFLAK